MTHGPVLDCSPGVGNCCFRSFNTCPDSYFFAALLYPYVCVAEQRHWSADARGAGQGHQWALHGESKVLSFAPPPLARLCWPPALKSKKVKAGRRVAADLPRQQRTPHRRLGQQVVSMHFWGGGGKNISIPPSSWEPTAPSAWRGKRSCLRWGFQQAQQSVLQRCFAVARAHFPLFSATVHIW